MDVSFFPMRRFRVKYLCSFVLSLEDKHLVFARTPSNRDSPKSPAGENAPDAHRGNTPLPVNLVEFAY